MDQANNKRWWLAINNQTDGPRTQAYILACLQSGQITSATQACLEGDAEWRPLNSWPELVATATNATTAPPPPPGFAAPPLPPGLGQPAFASTANDNLLTNPRLPKMANLICIFTIVLLPLYWAFDVLETMAEKGLTPAGYEWSQYEAIDFFFCLLIGGPVTLAITVLLVFGGLRLRDLRASGLRLICIGLWCDLAFLAFYIIIASFLLFTADTGSSEENANGFVILLQLITGFLGLAALVFEIIALVWLTKHASQLPLDRTR